MITDSSKLMAVYGPNSKQWYIYDEENDVYIDPPTDVLDEVESMSDDIDEQEEYLNDLIESLPDWLNEKYYWYDGDEIDI